MSIANLKLCRICGFVSTMIALLALSAKVSAEDTADVNKLSSGSEYAVTANITGRVVRTTDNEVFLEVTAIEKTCREQGVPMLEGIPLISKLFKNSGVVQTNKTVILRINKDDIKSIRARHGNAKPSCSVAEIKIDAVTNTQKLPTAHFSKDDVQYFASGKEFKLQLEAGQPKAHQAARKHHVASKDSVAPNFRVQWHVVPGNHGTVFWHSKASSHPKVDVFVAGTAKKSSKHCKSAKVTKRAPQHSAAKPLVTWTPQHPHIVGVPLPQPIPHVLPSHANNHHVELLHAKTEIVRLQTRLEWQERISELKEKHFRELLQAQTEVATLRSLVDLATRREEIIQQMAETAAERAHMETLLELAEEHPEIFSKRVHGGHAHRHPARGVQSAAQGVSPVEAENQRLRQRVAELQIRLLEIQSGSSPRHR